MNNFTELIQAAAIVILALFAVKNSKALRPFQVDVCVKTPWGEEVQNYVGDDENGVMQTYPDGIWSDMVPGILEKYPGSYCGKCGGTPVDCESILNPPRRKDK